MKKILFVYLPTISLWYQESFPPKGAKYFLKEKEEISQIKNLIDFDYQDLRLKKLEFKDYSQIFIYCDFLSDFPTIISTIELLKEKDTKRKIFFFGPLITHYFYYQPSLFASLREKNVSLIVGFLPNIIKEVLEKEKDIYLASLLPNYLPVPTKISLIIGCYCLPIFKPFCKNFLYFRENIKIRKIKEVINEVINQPEKTIIIDDEDIASNLDYYTDFFSFASRFRKHWLVKASYKIFESPQFIRLLAKAGVKIIYLNETWLTLKDMLTKEVNKLIKEKRKEVKTIQKEKILVGAKLSFVLENKEINFKKLYNIFRKIDFDFLEAKFFIKENQGFRLENITYQPFLKETSPAVLKREFYSLRNIIYRLSKRPRRVGFYNTFFYALPLNLAYRQNFLEGIPYPP
jgi:hypothetical protein